MVEWIRERSDVEQGKSTPDKLRKQHEQAHSASHRTFQQTFLYPVFRRQAMCGLKAVMRFLGQYNTLSWDMRHEVERRKEDLAKPSPAYPHQTKARFKVYHAVAQMSIKLTRSYYCHFASCKTWVFDALTFMLLTPY